MTPFSDLINQLSFASKPLPAGKVLRALRALGFQASISSLRQVITTSSSLSSCFKILEKHFPNAKTILADFQSSNEILDVLNGLPEQVEKDTNRNPISKKCAPFCEVLASNEFRAVDFNKHPPIGELFAFLWLVHSSIHASPGLVVPPKLANLLNVSISLARSMWMVVEDNPSFGTSWKFSLQDNLSDWFAEASNEIEQASKSTLALSITSKDIKDGFEEARILIGLLKTIQENDQQADDDNEDPQPRFSDQRGVSLYERERLSCHHNAFQELEVKKLSKSVRAIIEHDFNSEHLGLTYIDVLPPYYIEAFIIVLAIATGRSIEAAIRFPLRSGSEEYLENKLVSGLEKFNYPIWHRNISTNCQLRIPLPSFLKEPIAKLLHFDSAETIEDCLPYSITDWNSRCLNWLENNISGSIKEINRRVRDALVREIYRSTASPALLSIITTPISDIHFQNESLSRYVNPLDKRTLGAYENACTRIFNKYGTPSNICKLLARDDFAVSQPQHQQVAEYFLGQIATAGQADDFIAHHNWIARYILMLLIVATGHRKSLTPFFFPWDVLFEENLAFLCDKITVGSEARFVPIPDWLANLILDYRVHLHTLAKRLSSAPELAMQIQHLANGGDLSVLHTGNEIPANSPTKTKMGFGFFFTINGKLNGKTISTAHLEKSYSSVYSGKIGEFRKSAANSLWSGGYSGHQVEAFLGHNGEMHSFGESSAWAISGWANGIRKWQEEYLELGGWKSLNLNPPTARHSLSSAPEVPMLNTSRDSYEGRHRDKQQSLATAIKVIRENLPPIWFLDEKSAITAKDVQQLKDVVESKLFGDPDSCNQVNLALALEIDRIRKCIGKVSSTIANLTRTEPCPIPIFASRHYAVASGVRSWWLNKVGTYSISAAEDAAINKLAEIGISLIVFDAVLDKVTWAFILEEISLHETRKAHGCLTVRTQIVKQNRIYDKSVILSQNTSALILGFNNKRALFKPTNSTVKDVTKRINRLLRDAPTALSSEKLSVTNLICVFKPWWFIRLPGAQYSVATGEHSGPAADTLSECAMYDIPCGRTDTNKALVTPSTRNRNMKYDAKAAHKFINDFLNYAEGSVELKNASTRYQRQRLSHSLINFELPKIPELTAVSENQQIVSLMFEFLIFLLEEGGERKTVLTFNAIRTYYSNIHLLIDILWDRNILEFDTEDFDQAYLEIINRSKGKDADLGTPLSRFHTFMRETYSAPPSLVADTIKRIPSQCRSSVITPSQHKEAWERIGDYVIDDGQIIRHSKTFLYLIYNHGFRPKEAFGIRTKHIIAKIPIAIKIARNAARDLKTGNSLRVAHSMLAPDEQEKHFNAVVELADRSPVNNAYLFDDQEQFKKLYSTWEISKAVTNALRDQTGNPRTVRHSMRHSAATRLTHWAFVSPRSIPLSKYVENTLKGSLKEQSIFDCFEQGYSAWPFWIDRIGMYVGHAGVDTLLNTYWHTSSLRLAEHTWLASDNNPVTEPQLANMLGLSRTAILHQRDRLFSSANAKPSKNIIIESLITHYIGKSDIPVIGDSFDEASNIKPAKRSTDNSVTGSDAAGWISYDRLLCLRLKEMLTFEQAKEV